MVKKMCRRVGSENSRFHRWNDEEKQYLKEITYGKHYREILELMNNRFEYQFNIEQIKGAINRYKLKTGFNGKFKKGNKPWNKDKKGVSFGGEATWFKKGQAPVNHRPIGSERITKDGYTLIKTGEPDEWKLKHRIIYEQHYGSIPKGHVIIFADSNRQNFNIENLICVSRKKLKTMNQNNLIYNDANSTNAGSLVADVIIKIQELKKNKKENDNK